MFGKNNIITITLVLALASPALAQKIPVHINSGDPAFPFPQFLPYVHPNGDTLHNLGSRNPAGVVHAEMERTIRDAYRLLMNRAEYRPVRGLDGVGGSSGTRYIWFRSSPECSEGDGYGLLGAAMMADKVTFDGLWLRIHDNTMNKVTRYGDGTNAPSYAYSVLPGWTNSAGSNSAADGDFDIALALMIAHMQWGDEMGLRDSRGNMISYRDDFIKVIRGLTDTVVFVNNGALLSGDIGFDGFFKGGDSWSELSGWANNAANLASIGMSGRVEQPGPATQHIDYTAPAYFRQFADYLSKLDSARYHWNIMQFRRAEASSDWLFGKFIDQDPRHILSAGWVDMTSGPNPTPTFTNFTDGEDFRMGWRTVLSYVWHGNPSYSWNPSTHMITRGTSNTYQKNAGERFARFLWNRQQPPWNAGPETVITTPSIDFWGPGVLKYYYSPTGAPMATFPLNWLHGTGSPSAVTAKDFDLMGEMYRQCEIEMDVQDGTWMPGDSYLSRTPFYFHGIFRLLGMMILTGNHHAPLNMKRQANMKVYMDVDKTYAFENDTITYTIDYRNYGAEEARDVVISNKLHDDIIYLSSTGGGSLNPSTNTVEWRVGTVPGYKSSMGDNPTETKGRVTFKAIIPTATLKRYENSATITCSNGTGWVSNQYPNKISSVMKSNGVDIAKRALRGGITLARTSAGNVGDFKTRDTVRPGDTVTYKISFENSAEAGWLNGGRPGVSFSYMHGGTKSDDQAHTFQMRIFHDAVEPYIDYGNYRISYFMFDNGVKELANPPHQTTSGRWALMTAVPAADPALDPLVTPRHEVMPAGADPLDPQRRWNQRLIVQVANPDTCTNGPNTCRADTNWITMAATTPHLATYYGDVGRRIARGGKAPYKGTWTITNNYTNTHDWSGDWSYNPNVSGTTGNDGSLANWGFPVSPDYTRSYDPDYAGVPISHLHRKMLYTPMKGNDTIRVENILIEEWDGYTWRRVAGTGPVPGREVNNVVIRDTLPEGVTFIDFASTSVLGVTPQRTQTSSGREVITWTIDKMLTGEKGEIQVRARAKDLPAGRTSMLFPSRARLTADRESQMVLRCTLLVTTDELPCPPAPPKTTLTKTADKAAYMSGDTIKYVIGYKQTHGYTVESDSSSQWTGSGSSNVSGETINIRETVDMRFNPSNGTNMTLSGTLHVGQYLNPVTIYGRNNIELSFRGEWDGLHVAVRSGATVIENMIITYAQGDFPIDMDYKFVFDGNQLSVWFKDITTPLPYETFTLPGTPTAGYAGIRYTGPPEYNEGISIKNWTIHTDAAYNIMITDTIPDNIHYVANSATGISPLGTITGSYDQSNRVITWQVVTGDTPLAANDSVTLRWSAVVDSPTTSSIVNRAYADLRGLQPPNSLVAQLCSRFATEDIEDPPDTTKPDLGVSPCGGMFTGTVRVALSTSPNARIYHTMNGRDPAGGIGVIVSGDTTLEISNDTRLRVISVFNGDDGNMSDEISYEYEKINVVPVSHAYFFGGDVDDGLAYGVKIIARSSDYSRLLVRNHFDLIDFTGIDKGATIDESSLAFSGDTITLRFKCPIPATGASVVIREPTIEPCKEQQQYTAAHGYLSAGNYPISTEYVKVLTAPVFNAIFFDDVGDGRAHGIKVISRGGVYNADFVRSRMDLLSITELPGMPGFEPSRSRFEGDTLTLYFNGSAAVPSPNNAKLVIREPSFEMCSQEVAFGYLARDTVDIADGIAPILLDALYIISGGNTGGVNGDTLVVVFSKLAMLREESGTVPFKFKRGGDEYRLELDVVSRRGDTIRFAVVDMIHTQGVVDYPEAGDMVNIVNDGAVSFFSYEQLNKDNTPVPLRIRYPEVDYEVKIGPNPFRDSVRVMISVIPYQKGVFDELDPEVRVLDRMGRVVAVTGENLRIEKETEAGAGRYLIVWNGQNRKGRRAGTGTYVLLITIKDHNGERRTVGPSGRRPLVYLRRAKAGD